MARKLSDSVVVITGASSGIGKATALRFARSGATVVVAARREAPLVQVADECRRLGVPALAVTTDVTDEEAVEALARRAIESFGRIDTWVNNAGVYALGNFEELPRDVFRRVIDTNLLGAVHGCRATLPYMREQGSGVIVNVGSIFSVVGAPYASAYVASKFGLRGFTECLRQETARDGISVSCVLPAAIDTPLYQHTANYTGRRARPVRPVYAADDVARAILSCATRPRREVLVGSFAPIAKLLHGLLPAVHERVMPPMMEKLQLGSDRQGPTPGNLFEPMVRGTRVSGGYGGRSAVLRKVVVAALPVVAAFAINRTIQGRVARTVGQALVGRALARLAA